MNKAVVGFEERPHISDLALFVWADLMSELFVQAGKGLGELLKPDFAEDDEHFQISIPCEAIDLESLLVAFLSEILYLNDKMQILYTPISARIEEYRLTARMEGKRVARAGREIKAATYSDLQIIKTRTGFETTIVFDI